MTPVHCYLIGYYWLVTLKLGSADESESFSGRNASQAQTCLSPLRHRSQMRRKLSLPSPLPTWYNWPPLVSFTGVRINSWKPLQSSGGSWHQSGTNNRHCRQESPTQSGFHLVLREGKCISFSFNDSSDIQITTHGLGSTCEESQEFKVLQFMLFSTDIFKIREKWKRMRERTQKWTEWVGLVRIRHHWEHIKSIRPLTAHLTSETLQRHWAYMILASRLIENSMGICEHVSVSMCRRHIS